MCPVNRAAPVWQTKLIQKKTLLPHARRKKQKDIHFWAKNSPYNYGTPRTADPRSFDNEPANLLGGYHAQEFELMSCPKVLPSQSLIEVGFELLVVHPAARMEGGNWQNKTMKSFQKL